MRSKKNTFTISVSLILALIAIIFVVLPIYRSAQGIGEKVGVASGKAVGVAVGSFKGVTEDYPKGFEEGKEAGKSAEDTRVEMQNSLTEINRLEVLVSSFKVNNYHQFSDKYAALYLAKAEAVFTVDLSKASVDASDDGMTLFITIPQPDVDVYIDERKTEKAWERQKHWFSGNAEDGFDIYINSLDQIEKNARLSIQNDEAMMRSARTSAETQIEQIANGV